MTQLDPDKLTWTALLAHWVEFAQSAAALPDDTEGQRLRQVVPDLVMVQAVWFALQHLEDMEPDQLALGLDRAELLIEKHSAVLNRQWSADSRPPAVVELIEDARVQLDTSWRKWGGGFGRAGRIKRG